jgi:16S rRNA (uracil1498-N3)-methyltransferase
MDRLAPGASPGVITLLIEPRRLAGGDGEAISAAGEGAAGRPGADSAAESPPHALRIEGDAYRHLFRARRLAVGDRLRLVDGEGGARWGEVLQVGRTAAVVAVREAAGTNEPVVRLELLVPTLRPERASWLVEKATEVGAAGVTFHNSERAPRAFGGGTLARLRRVAAAAVEQCHRSCCPEIAGPFPLASLLRAAPFQGAASAVGAARAGFALAGAPRLWLLDPAASVAGFHPSAHELAPDAARGPRAERLLVGPEGGWTAAELAALRAAGWQGVSLGPRVLRIETAAVAAAALLLLSPPDIT